MLDFIMGSWGDLHDHLLSAQKRVSDELARTQRNCRIVASHDVVVDLSKGCCWQEVQFKRESSKFG